MQKYKGRKNWLGGEKTDSLGKEWAGPVFPQGKNWLGGNSGLLHRDTEQVAQRATIAHPSPMCQGQISFQKHINGPQKPEAQNWSCPSFYACPGYQQLWWWFDQKWMSLHGDTIFPLEVYGKFFRRSRAVNSIARGPIWPKFRTCLRFYACPHYLSIKRIG